MPKVSVIIPVYRAAATIVRCVESLLLQTLADLEVILVDDHGGDESLELVKSLLANHHRKPMFRFAATPQNSGPGAARNVGIQLAQGEYVAFCDSDDWIEPIMYRTLYKQASEHNADICCCNALQERKGKTTLLKNPKLPNGLFSVSDKQSFLVNYASYFTTFIYKRTFLTKSDILFPAERSAEDSYFLLCCLLYAQRTAQTDQPFYHYLLQDNSLSRQVNATRYLQKLSVAKRILDDSKKHGFYDNYRHELDYIYLKKGYLMATMNYLWNVQKPQIDVINKINRTLAENVPDYTTNPYFLKQPPLRILIFLLHKMPRTATKLIPMIINIFNITV